MNLLKLVLGYFLGSSSLIDQEIEHHYKQFPLEDVKLRFPLSVYSELQFPDLEEATRIQVRKRLESFQTLPEIDLVMVDDYSPDVLHVTVHLDTGDAISVDGYGNSAVLFQTLRAVDANDTPFFLAQLLVDHAWVQEMKWYGDLDRIRDFSSGNTTTVVICGKDADGEVLNVIQNKLNPILQTLQPEWQIGVVVKDKCDREHINPNEFVCWRRVEEEHGDADGDGDGDDAAKPQGTHGSLENMNGVWYQGDDTNDYIWSCTQQLLTSMGAPDEQMGPLLRVGGLYRKQAIHTLATTQINSSNLKMRELAVQHASNGDFKRCLTVLKHMSSNNSTL